jgi:hypothetical protein
MKRFHHLFLLIVTFLCSSFIFAAAAAENKLDPVILAIISKALESWPLMQDPDTAASQGLVNTGLNPDTAESHQACEQITDMFLNIITERIRKLPKGCDFEDSPLRGEVSRLVNKFFTQNPKKEFDSKKELEDFCIETGVFIRDYLDNIQRGSKGPCDKAVSKAARSFLSKIKKPNVLPSATTESTSGFVGSLENLDILLEEGFLTNAQHHHFQEASKFVSEDFLENLQLNLSFTLNMNFHLFSKNINFELIRITFDRASVFRDAIIFYAQREKKFLKIRYYHTFLKCINNSNVDERIAHFYTIVSSGGSEFQVEYKAPYEDTGSIKDSEILEEYPFLKSPVDKGIVQNLINKLLKYNFLSERQATRFSEKIEKSLEFPQLLTLVMREAFKQASMTCITAKKNTLADNLEAAVMLHFNNKELYKELDGPAWIARIQENIDNEAELKKLDDEMYELLAKTPERAPMPKPKKSPKKKK